MEVGFYITEKKSCIQSVCALICLASVRNLTDDMSYKYITELRRCSVLRLWDMISHHRVIRQLTTAESDLQRKCVKVLKGRK